MLKRAALLTVALAVGAATARAQEPESPPAEPEAVAPQDPAAVPAAGDTAGTPAEEPTLRRRRRPKLSVRLPEHQGIVEVGVGLHLAWLLGAAQKDDAALLGTRYEYRKDLDLTPVLAVPVLDLNVHLARRFSIVLDFLTTTASGRKAATFQTAYEGLNFPAGTVLDADLRVTTGSIAARYFASSTERSTFEIEAGVRYFGVRFDLGGTSGGVSVGSTTETTDAFVPFVGFLGSFDLWKWNDDAIRIDGRARLGILGIGDSSDNQTNAYVHAYVGISVPLSPLRSGRFNIRLTLGYEFMRIDAQREDKQLDEDFEFALHGPAFRVIIGF